MKEWNEKEGKALKVVKSEKEKFTIKIRQKGTVGSFFVYQSITILNKLNLFHFVHIISSFLIQTTLRQPTRHIVMLFL